MAKEIEFTDATGQTGYANLLDAGGQWYNTATPGFEAFSAAHWTDYDLAATEFGASGVYAADMPAVAAGTYNVVARRRAGGSPAQSDAVVAAGQLGWNGAAVMDQADVRAVGGSLQSAGGLSFFGSDYLLGTLHVNVGGTVDSVGPTGTAAIAAAWGASVVGNGRTRDYFLQGGINRTVFAPDGLSFTVFSTDDTTVLCAGVAVRNPLNTLTVLDPT